MSTFTLTPRNPPPAKNISALTLRKSDLTSKDMSPKSELTSKDMSSKSDLTPNNMSPKSALTPKDSPLADVVYFTSLIDKSCKNYNECNNLEEELESAKFECNTHLKRNDITGFKTDENNQVIDNTVCELLHSRIAQIKATKELFVHRKGIFPFIQKSQGKSDDINNDNRYGIIFKDGKIQNMDDIYVYKNRNKPPVTLRSTLNYMLTSKQIMQHKRNFDLNYINSLFDSHKRIEILSFIKKSQGKSDDINNDNKYGIIFKDGKIQNMDDIYIYTNRDNPPITLRMLLFDPRVQERSKLKINFDVKGVGKKQTRRKINKKRTNKKKSKTNKTYKKKSNKKKTYKK